MWVSGDTGGYVARYPRGKEVNGEGMVTLDVPNRGLTMILKSNCVVAAVTTATPPGT